MLITRTKDGKKTTIFQATGIAGLLAGIAFVGFLILVLIAALWPLWFALAALKFLFS